MGTPGANVAAGDPAPDEQLRQGANCSGEDGIARQCPGYGSEGMLGWARQVTNGAQEKAGNRQRQATRC